ncbi:hypothetical protein PINS_up000320 [Pythium insidiosum]|nr:hypothetical protein PINS_up000320 [Pythium insidiosum]
MEAVSSRRCVQSGDYASGLDALMSVISVSDLDSYECRDALLLAAQMLIALQRFDRALQIMQELFPRLPSPYIAEDGALIILTRDEWFDRLHDPDYLRLRDVLFGGFPPLYSVLFGAEDDVVQRIHPLSPLGRRAPRDGIENSPTRRKLHAVKQHRKTPVRLETLELCDAPSPPQHALGTEREEDELETSTSHSIRSLLDVYQFPPIHRSPDKQENAFPPSALHLNLNEIEEFARLALYRSRVLVGAASDTELLTVETVQPSWLLRFDAICDIVREHQRRERLGACFTEVHSRVLRQLTQLRSLYTESYGKTSFTIAIGKHLHDLRDWRFLGVQALLNQLAATRDIGLQEETQRNLEFRHVRRVEERTSPRDSLNKGTID